MSAPLIGVTTRNARSELYQIDVIQTPRPYSEALVRAGAIPVLIPLNLPPDRLQELLARLDGVVFTGGGDIETGRFGGVPHDKIYDVDPERDEIEIQLVQQVAEGGMPFLGICRGLQIVNVAFGGSLYTHIPDQLPGALQHSNFPGHPWDYLAHPVQVGEGSRLAEILGEPIVQVNSLHHQGIKELAIALRATASAPDGLIEAVELPDHPFAVCVQWHPECLPDDPRMQNLFRSLVSASQVS
ncbi:MAG: gamma-glutamyl-gamma-aminobutyrate hydrolase family protein [Anaerolineales bacterium]|nr:gamma-glutamyl-gamma-aminobutyrate hydrolase family protein [Anaerolineales bacterium]